MRKVKRNNLAVNEVLDTILLIGIAVALFSVLSFIVLTYPFEPSTPSVNIVGFVDGNDIVLEHRGGESLDLDTEVLITVGGEKLAQNKVRDFLDDNFEDDGLWGLGEILNYTSDAIDGNQVTVTIIDTKSNSVVMMGTLQEGFSTSPLTETSVNTISPYKQTSTCSISASGDSRLDSVALWYRYTFFWEDNFDNDDSLVSSYNNITFDGGDHAVVTSSGGDIGVEDYVDNDISNVDGSIDKGTHSNFDDEKAKDLSYDTLTEENTASTTTLTLLDDDFESGLYNWNTNWEISDLYYVSPTHSAECDRYDDNLVSGNLDTSDASSISITFSYRIEYIDDNDNVYVQYYDGNQYDNIDEIGDDAENTWLTYEHTFDNSGSDTQYFINNFRLGIRGSSIDNGEYLWIDDVLITKTIEDTHNYELDLEIQWTNVDYTQTNEELCIFFDSTSSENLKVDLWDGSSWQNIFTNLENGWNNISVTSWLTESTFTIRYKDESPTGDSTMDSWNIDAALIRSWSTTDVYYEGWIKSVDITKPSTSNWDKFYADVDNPTDSTFSILNIADNVLLSGLDGDGDDISSISSNKIRLYGEFNGPVTLDSWNVSTTPQGVWAEWSDSSNPDAIFPWNWNFDFTDGIGNYEFYSIGKYGSDIENPPVYADARCYYNPN